MLPLSLAIVCNVFPPPSRPRALGIWAGISALALGDRPAGRRCPGRNRLAGDLLDQPAGCRGRRSRSRRSPRRSRPIPAPDTRIDLRGPGGAQRRARRRSCWRWSRRAIWGARAILLWLRSVCRRPLLAFWRIEQRVNEPIVDFALFRNGPYFGASAAAFALVGSYWAVMFFQPQYLQDVRGHSAVLSGLLILPITVPMIFDLAILGAADRSLRRPPSDDGRNGLRTRRPSRPHPDRRHAAPTALILAGYLLFGVALGLVYAPMSTAAMAAMPAREGRHRLGRARDGSGNGRHDRSRRNGRALPRPRGPRQLLRRRGCRLDLVLGRPLRRRRLADLGLRARHRLDRPRPHDCGRTAARRPATSHSPSPLPPLSGRLAERFTAICCAIP